MTSANLPLQEELTAFKKRLDQLESFYQQESLDLKKQLQQWEYRFHQQQKPESKAEEPSVIIIAPPVKPETSVPPKVVSPKAPEAKANKPKAVKAPQPPRELSPAIQMLLHPFQQVGEYARTLYNHYKEDGKLPVFFMTLGGIFALLFGFGYLMQMGISLLLDHLSERFFLMIKLGGSFAFTTAVIFWGQRLIRKGQHYRDFGAAMLGLGVAINYLVLYFMSDNGLIPVLHHPIIGWGLALLNSALGVWLGLRHEARIVAAISLLGGAFVPFYLHSASFSVFYLGYLWVLCFTALWLSQKIEWPVLRGGAFVVFAFLVEWIWFQHPERFGLAELCIALHAFVYLFIASAIRNGNKWRKQLDRQSLFLIAASIGIGILNLFLLFADQQLWPMLGWIYLGNAALVGFGLAINYENWSADLRWVAFLLIGGLAALAVPAIFDRAWMGLAWAFEGILLLMMGHRFGHQRLRIEAFVLIGIALAKMSFYLPMIIELWEMSIWHTGSVQWLCIGIVLGTLWAIYHYFTLDTDWEKRFAKQIPNAVYLWLGLTLVLISLAAFGLWGWLSAGIAVLGLIVAGNRQQLAFSEVAGFIFMFFLIIPYFISAEIVDSLRLHLQLWPAKIGILMIGVLAFGLQSLYEKYLHTDKTQPFWSLVVGLREAVWLILPALWLKPIIRLWPEHLAPALLISMIAALLLRTYLARKERMFVSSALLMSVYVYFAGLVLTFFFGVEAILSHLDFGFAQELAYWYAYLPGLGCIVMATYYQLQKQVTASNWWEGSFLWMAMILWHFLTVATDGSGAPFALLFVGTVLRLLTPTALQALGAENNKFWLRIPTNILIVMAVLSYILLVGFEEGRFGLPMAVCMAALVYVAERSENQKKRFAFITTEVNRWFIHLLLPIFYLPLQASLFGGGDHLMGPGATAALVLHAVLLLFTARGDQQKNFVRYSLFLFIIAFSKLVLYDFSHFSILNKVLVSMGIGGIMLMGSRLFLRLRREA